MEADPRSPMERLALERTQLANERTLLAYSRTAIMIVATGFTLLYLEESTFLELTGWALNAVGLGVALVGVARFRMRDRRFR